jgi:hypothetical protein
MAVTYVCDRCGYRTEDLGIVKRYMLALTPEDNGTAGAVPARSRKTADPAKARTVDLCDKCVDRAWRVIAEQLFKAEK